MKKTLSVLLVAATGLSGLTLAHAQVNSGTGANLNGNSAVQRQRPEKPPFNCVVTNISNGITITLTSSDAALVTKLQAEAANHIQAGIARHGQGATDIQSASENLSNGIKITLTSANAATVTKLQSKPAKGPKEMPQNVTVTSEKLSNGIAITRTSTDAATVTKLQEMEAKLAANHQSGTTPDGKPKLEGVTIKVENLSNGVKTIFTSDNAETVTKLQNMPTEARGHGHRGARGPRGMDKAPAQE